MDSNNELVLSIVQPYMEALDHIRSRIVSRYLLKTGNEDPDRPTLQPIELSQEYIKKDKVRLNRQSQKKRADMCTYLLHNVQM